MTVAVRVFESPSDQAYYFGYFNTPQVSGDGKKILALRVKRFDRVPESGDVAEVGWFEIGAKNAVFQKVGETSAYNWQQGAMLQFLGPDFSKRIIWNYFSGEEYRACIHDLETGNEHNVPAVYNVFSDGENATSIDFERHAWCRRGYSYGNVMNQAKSTPIVAGDAIFKIDLNTGEKVPIILLDAMMQIRPLSTMHGATHYLEHMTSNPSGSHFAFLHRWRHENGIHSRFLVARADGSDVKILNDSGRMSHFCWRDETQILGYGGKSNSINRLRRRRALIKTIFKPLLPLYKRLVRDSSKLAKSLTGDAYYIFDIDLPGELQLVASSMRAEDGHPSMLPGGKLFVTDTYARTAHGQKPKLFIVDMFRDTYHIVDELSSIEKYDETPMRCDLHPRVSPSGDIISIDTMDGNQRRVYAYRLQL